MTPKKAYRVIHNAIKRIYESEDQYTKLFTRDVLLAVQYLDAKYHEESEARNRFIDKCVENNIPVTMGSEDDWKTAFVVYDRIYGDYNRTDETLSPTNVSHVQELNYISDRWNAPHRVKFLRFFLENYTLDDCNKLIAFLHNLEHTEYMDFMKDANKKHESKNILYTEVDMESNILNNKMFFKSHGMYKGCRKFENSRFEGNFNNVLVTRYFHEQTFRPYFSYEFLTHEAVKKYLYTSQWIWEINKTTRFGRKKK